MKPSRRWAGLWCVLVVALSSCSSPLREFRDPSPPGPMGGCAEQVCQRELKRIQDEVGKLEGVRSATVRGYGQTLFHPALLVDVQVAPSAMSGGTSGHRPAGEAPQLEALGDQIGTVVWRSKIKPITNVFITVNLRDGYPSSGSRQTVTFSQEWVNRLGARPTLAASELVQVQLARVGRSVPAVVIDGCRRCRQEVGKLSTALASLPGVAWVSDLTYRSPSVGPTGTSSAASLRVGLRVPMAEIGNADVISDAASEVVRGSGHTSLGAARITLEVDGDPVLQFEAESVSSERRPAPSAVTAPEPTKPVEPPTAPGSGGTCATPACEAWVTAIQQAIYRTGLTTAVPSVLYNRGVFLGPSEGLAIDLTVRRGQAHRLPELTRVLSNALTKSFNGRLMAGTRVKIEGARLQLLPFHVAPDGPASS